MIDYCLNIDELETDYKLAIKFENISKKIKIKKLNFFSRYPFISSEILGAEINELIQYFLGWKDEDESR